MGFFKNNRVYKIKYSKTNITRDFLKITVNQNPIKKVLVIMKNPSSTCNNMINGTHVLTKNRDKTHCTTDRTTSNILKKLRKKYDEIIVLNLFSFYSSKPSDINNFLKSKNGNFLKCSNDHTINVSISSYTGDIICAWGNNNGIDKIEYLKQISFVFTLFNSNHKLLEYNKSSKRFKSLTSIYPLHGFNWK